MGKAVLALGTNLGDRLSHLEQAAAALGALCGTTLSASSYVYETKPVGYADQPLFLNAAVLADTALSPRALLGACLGIEASLGRTRTQKNGPRTIDIDLLLYDEETSRDAELTLPHPRLRERAFVLAPLADLFPDGKALEMDLAEEYRALPDLMRTQGVMRLKGPRLSLSGRLTAPR